MVARWVFAVSGWMLVAACGDDQEVSIDDTGSSDGSSSTPPEVSTEGSDSTSSSGSDPLLDSSDSDESSGTTGDPNDAPLRAVLIGDPLGDGSTRVFLVETDGVDVSAPVVVDGAAPRGGELGMRVLSSELLLVTTEAADGARSHALVDVSGAEPSSPTPLVLAPAPTGHVTHPIVADGEAVFTAAASVDAEASVWSTTYEGTIAAAPERLSPDLPGYHYPGSLALSPDAVIALRTEVATGIENLVWMPRAPADPDAAAVVTAHDESWQNVTTAEILPDGEHIVVMGRLASEEVTEVFVDDLDSLTAPVRAHPEVGVGDTAGSSVVAPDGSAIAVWVGNFDGGSSGDVFIASLTDGALGESIDVSSGDHEGLFELRWSPDSRWFMHRLREIDDFRVDIVSVEDGVTGESVTVPGAHSMDVEFDEDVTHLYYEADGALYRVALGDAVGDPELVSRQLVSHGIQLSPTGDWLGFSSLDGKPLARSLYVVDISDAEPGTVRRVDVPPEPGADGGLVVHFSANDEYALYTEFVDLDTPRALRATRLVDGGGTVLLGHSFLGYATLPREER
jgi:hypothetical protein